MIESLIASLGGELGLTSKEIADVVWLALQMNDVDRSAEAIDQSAAQPEKVSQTPNLTHLSADDYDSPAQRKRKNESEPEVGLYPPGFGQSAGMVGALALKVPDARSLREPLALARALKPLLRQVMTGYSTVLDEAATVERIADEGVWLPVLKPSLEPWLELALVVDEGVSMQIWRRTIVELQRFMEHYGVFRDVRVWGLLTDEAGQVQIRPGIGRSAKRQGLRRPSALIDPSGRRLVLVVTDCVADLWRDGTMQSALKLWAASGPMAIVQMLPEWLWARTGLGFASAVRLQGLAAGLANQQLQVRNLSAWDEVDLATGIRVPVVTLEPERLGAWAQMLTGKGGAWSAGVVFDAVGGDVSLPLAQDGEWNAAQRVQQFRATASPMARRLAGLLAAAPVISLPVVRIIQERLLAESRQVHVAEVFLGGLLKPLVEITAQTNVDAVQYEFWDGVRDTLLESVRTSETMNVLNEVSQFVAERLGLSIDQFTAVLQAPQQVENQQLVDNIRPFATVEAQILQKLGGAYTEFAKELQAQFRDTKLGSKPFKEPDRDAFEYPYEANLIILGEAGVGKTSLANKLINPNYNLDDEQSTKGVDLLHLHFQHSSGRTFRINVRDFGGQEIYHATHQFFLTKRSLYLVVIDTRQRDTDLNYWLEIVELLAESSPTLIIKNEKQDRPCEVNENQLRGRFPNLEKILPTNLATNRGLPDILTAVQHHISQLSHIGTPVPKTWVNVRKALETDNRNHITQTEFLTLCDTHGFKRHADKLQLSGYLHDLGVCLHFQDDDLLQRTIILKPEWVTTAVYKVLDTPKVRQAFGHFTSEDLKTIWADEQYAGIRPELLQLMKNFKLCYEIPHKPKTYIAPQLFSANQPNYTWEDTDNLILRYEYDFMPKGMLTRFIVEMHRLIDNELVWKEGVILTQDNSCAEIIEAYYKKEIRIRISGKLKKPLLEAIRHEFAKIHTSYERLRYQEFIPCNCSVCKGSQTPSSYPLNRLLERLKTIDMRSNVMLATTWLISATYLTTQFPWSHTRDPREINLGKKHTYTIMEIQLSVTE